MLIDTHVHLTGDALWPDRNEILRNCQASKVGALLNVCLTERDLERASAFSNGHLPIVHAAAMHPAMREEDAPSLKSIEAAARVGQLVAIGETGLDYVRAQCSPSEQAERFLLHMDLARAMHLPLIVHCRGAFHDFIDQLDRHYAAKPSALPGVLHCFSEGPEELKLLVARGWSVGFGGLTTYKAAENVQRAAATAPSEHFVLETDCPYLSPEPHRKERNEPARVALIAVRLAHLRKQTIEQIAMQSTRNARRLLQGLDRALREGGVV